MDGARLSLLVGLPGGGTTWFFEALVAGQGPGSTQHSGFFHPFCNQLWRVELSHFVAGSEDLSRIHLFREHVPTDLFDDLVQRMLWQHLNGSSSAHAGFLTRENFNIWRVPDLVRNGFRPVALFRHRRHTFPLSDSPGSPSWAELLGNLRGDNDFRYAALCRTCFYFTMYFAPQMGARGTVISDPCVLTLARVAALAPDAPLAKQVAAHMLFWYVILRLARLGGYRFPIVDYEGLVRSSPDELLGLLSRTLPPGIDAPAVARFTLDTRKDPAWLDRKERQYSAAEGYREAEMFVGVMLATMRRVDPETSVDMLQ